MRLRKKNLNLIWRIVGGNVLLLILGFLLIGVNVNVAMYTIYTNFITILLLSYQIIKKDLTLESEYAKVFIIYFVAKVVMTLFMVDTEEKSILATLELLINALWIYKWYMLPKRYNE